MPSGITQHHVGVINNNESSSNKYLRGTLGSTLKKTTNIYEGKLYWNYFPKYAYYLFLLYGEQFFQIIGQLIAIR